MSEQSSPWNQTAWPKDCPRPGDPAWPDGAIRWLHDHIPGNTWRHRSLTGHPWVLSTTAAIHIRAQLDALREQYSLTINMWAPLLPPAVAQSLVDDTVREGRRLAVLLDEVLALEVALAPGGMRGPSPDVRPGP